MSETELMLAEVAAQVDRELAYVYTEDLDALENTQAAAVGIVEQGGN